MVALVNVPGERRMKPIPKKDRKVLMKNWFFLDVSIISLVYSVYDIKKIMEIGIRCGGESYVQYVEEC